MTPSFIEEKVFEGINYKETPLAKGDYDNCTFKNCDFNNTNLSNINFSECIFDSCDFSLVKIKNTVLNDIRFNNCKILGVHFEECNDLILSVSFDNCQLKLSNFYKLKLKKTAFIGCNLNEADFTETDLSKSIFDDCDLKLAIFNQTDLRKADLYSSYNYSIDPEENRIKKAKFSRAGVVGLLDKYNINIQI